VVSAANSCPAGRTHPQRGYRNLRAVQTLLGHASIATTERYTAVDDAEVRATAMAAIYTEVNDPKRVEAINRLTIGARPGV
jgi:hypothetical protein